MEDLIKSNKVQQELISKRYDLIPTEIETLLQLTIPTDTPDYTFQKIFELTDEV